MSAKPSNSAELEGAPFVVKTFQIVSDSSTNTIVSWAPNGESFIIWDPVDFAAEILPKYFKHKNFGSFTRQLNTYGFKREDGTKNWEVKHESGLFREGRPELLKDIQRRKPKKRVPTNPSEMGMPLNQPSQPNPIANIGSINGNGAVQHNVMATSQPLQLIQQQSFQHQAVNNLDSESDGIEEVESTIPMVLPNGAVSYASEQQLQIKDDLESEIDQMRELNQMLLNEVLRLQVQQKATQSTVQQLMSQVIESQKETRTLRRKFSLLADQVSSYIAGTPSTDSNLSTNVPSEDFEMFSKRSKMDRSADVSASPSTFMGTFTLDPNAFDNLFPNSPSNSFL